MRFREHRGGLKESMETCVTLKDAHAFEAHIAAIFDEPMMKGFAFTPELIQVSEYHMEPDTRIGWDKTYLVVIKGYGVLGFADEMPEPLEK